MKDKAGEAVLVASAPLEVGRAMRNEKTRTLARAPGGVNTQRLGINMDTADPQKWSGFAVGDSLTIRSDECSIPFAARAG